MNIEDTRGEDHGPEMTRLLDRLYGDPNKRTMNFNIFPGPLWDTLTMEERAKTLNDAMDSVEDGSAELIENFDD